VRSSRPSVLPMAYSPPNRRSTTHSMFIENTDELPPFCARRIKTRNVSAMYKRRLHPPRPLAKLNHYAHLPGSLCVLLGFVPSYAQSSLLSDTITNFQSQTRLDLDGGTHLPTFRGVYRLLTTLLFCLGRKQRKRCGFHIVLL
jgi:hypothetical protein